MGRRQSFLTGCLAETALFLVALFCGSILGSPPLATLHYGSSAALLGLAAVLPLFGFLVYTLHSRLKPLVRHRQFLDSLLQPLLAKWSVLQLALISLLAGFCEEALFRGVLQGALQSRLDSVVGLGLASVLFGFAHPLSRTYIVIAAVLGAYLGLLWNWTGDLLAPMVTHAVYDFVALFYLLRIKGTRPAASR